MKLELPERKKLVHTMQMPIRWGDMDAMGHVNNTLYFRYLEVARIEWFRTIGCNVNPQGPLIVNAFCNFHKQLEYPGDIVVKMYASDPGRSSFESWGEIVRGRSGDRLCERRRDHGVWISGRSVRAADWFREILS